MPSQPYRLEINKRTGKWEIRWTENDPAASRARSRYHQTGAASRSEAELAAAIFWDKKNEIAKSLETIDVDRCISGYLISAEDGRQIGQTQRRSLKPIQEHFGAMTAGNITTEDGTRYLLKRKLRGVTPGSVRRELGALTAALNWAAKKGRLISKHDLPSFDLPPDSPAREVYLSDEEEQQFWDLAVHQEDKNGHLTRLARYVALSLATAARAEAVRQLDWLRVNKPPGYVDYNVPGRKVTKKNRKVIPIADRLSPILERADRERRQRGEPDTTPVIGPGPIRTQWENWLATTPFTHIRPHDLRRTWASLALQAGTSIELVADVLGDDVETVRKHYAFFIPGHLVGAINSVRKKA